MWLSMCMWCKLTWTLTHPTPDPVTYACIQKRARLLARFSPRWHNHVLISHKSIIEHRWPVALIKVWHFQQLSATVVIFAHMVSKLSNLRSRPRWEKPLWPRRYLPTTTRFELLRGFHLRSAATPNIPCENAAQPGCLLSLTPRNETHLWDGPELQAHLRVAPAIRKASNSAGCVGCQQVSLHQLECMPVGSHSCSGMTKAQSLHYLSLPVQSLLVRYSLPKRTAVAAVRLVATRSKASPWSSHTAAKKGVWFCLCLRCLVRIPLLVFVDTPARTWLTIRR